MYKQLLFFSFIISSVHAMETNVLDLANDSLNLDYEIQASDAEIMTWLDQELERFEKSNPAQDKTQKPELMGKKIGAATQFFPAREVTPFEETFGPMFAQSNPELSYSRIYRYHTEVLEQNSDQNDEREEEDSNEQVLQDFVMRLGLQAIKRKLTESEKSSPKPLTVKTPTGVVPLIAFNKEQMNAYAQRCEEYRRSLKCDVYDALEKWCDEVIEEKVQR